MIHSQNQKKSGNEIPVQKSFSITFNSGIATALNPLGDNNLYKVTLDNGIGVPSYSKSCEVACVQASVWNYDQNIEEPNNRIYYKPNAIDPETFISIPPGYYGITELNAQVKVQLQLAGDISDLFTFLADTATQKVVVIFGADDSYLNFNPVDSIKEILGFDSRYSPITAPGTPASDGDIDVADNIAKFNSVNGFLIECGSIVNDGLPINAIGSSVVAQIPITSAPNSLITYSPNYPIWIDCDHLIGSSITDINFGLKNELLQAVKVLDSFSFTLTVRWTE